MKIERLGIELRKIGSINSLYQEVDLVLQKYNILNNSISIDVQVQAVAHSLQKMLKTENHFSICTVRDCAKLSQLCIPYERMNIYEAIHCVSWNEMLPEFRQMIVAMILDDFRAVLNPNEL